VLIAWRDIGDALITKMMNYLQEKKADDLAKAQPAFLIGRTLAHKLTYKKLEMFKSIH